MSQEPFATGTGNNIMVISGPSGSGKSTLINMLLKKYPEISFAVSHTTRPPRNGEAHGRQYYFVGEQEFRKMREQNQFLEWARVHNHYYGTSLKEIKSKLEAGGILVLDLDVQGARNLKEIFAQAVFILIVPPSLEELKKRLVRRHGGDDQREIEKRMSAARDELCRYGLYDFMVVNEQLETAFCRLDCIYVALNQRIGFNINIIEKMIGRSQ